jgi:branched-chain amino acid transport system permease protein
MSTVEDITRPVRLRHAHHLIRDGRSRRLAGWALGGVVIAIVTGPEGRIGQPTYSVSHALKPAHLFTCVGIALAVGILAEVWLRYRTRVREAVLPARVEVRRTWEQPLVRAAAYLVAVILLIVLPDVLLGQYWQGVLVEQIGIYALLALGLNVVVGFAGLLDLGYIAFYAIGAYTTAYFTHTLPVAPPFTLNPFFVIPLAVGAAMLAGLILGAPTLRLRGDYLAIVTLGFGEIITILAVNMDSFTNGARGAFGIPPFSLHLGPLNYDWGLTSLPYYYLLLVFGGIIFFLFRLLENSRVGRAWTAIREDEVAAQACGIPPVKYKLMAFAIGASTSGFAGVLYASKISYINPSSFTVSFSILVLVFVIFGGMGSLIGSIVGAAVLQTVFAYVRKNNTVDPADIYIYVGALLIVMMIFRPQGIVPSRRRAREIGLAEHGVGTADALAAPIGSPDA